MNPNPLPILYSFRRCPYAMRARLAIAASAVVCELREVLLRDKPQAMLQLSPKGTVPVLVLPGGAVLEQSLDIMHWALGQNDPQAWLPDSAVQQEHTQALIQQCDGPFKQHLDRYKYPNRFGLVNGSQARAAASGLLTDCNARLAMDAYLHGSHWGLADAAIAPFVRQFAHTDPAWFAQQPWPALQSWLAQFESSSALEHVMGKYAPWVEGQAAVMFP